METLEIFSLFLTIIPLIYFRFLFILQAQKMDRIELAGSLVAQCWTTFIDESDKIVKMIKVRLLAKV